MAIISKGNFMLLMGDDLDAFTSFLFSPGGAMTKWQIEQADGFELDDPLVVKKLAALRDAGVIKAETYDRILSANDGIKTVQAQLRKYDISSVGGELHVWIQDNIQPTDAPYELVGDMVITSGDLPLKVIG